MENAILMKTKSSVWTWTLDFDLGFVNWLLSDQILLCEMSLKMVMCLKISRNILFFFVLKHLQVFLGLTNHAET